MSRSRSGVATARAFAASCSPTRAPQPIRRTGSSSAARSSASPKRRARTAIANMQIAGLVGKSTRDKRPDIYDAMHRMIAQGRVEGIVGGTQAMMTRPDSTPTLATIDVPTLVVVGEEDAITPRQDAEALHRGIAGSRLEVLQQAGHLSNVERPAAFNTVMSEFLGSLLYN